MSSADNSMTDSSEESGTEELSIMEESSTSTDHSQDSQSGTEDEYNTQHGEERARRAHSNFENPIDSWFVSPPGLLTYITNLSTFRQQLMLLLHANKCLQRNRLRDNTSPCPLADCEGSKRLINHMNNCTADKYCTEHFCLLYKKFMRHWYGCDLLDCNYCQKLDLAINPS